MKQSKSRLGGLNDFGQPLFVQPILLNIIWSYYFLFWGRKTCKLVAIYW